ncbi:hypothetical protein CS0771_02520 [Catellatospora sp. IY07-71]|uniref:nucleotidyltransferase domain-containing protein n=1 Tax=Catellatospora sp. IY07-71 TaxID=2728827 RepID=UPI001BB39DF2|nr:nucleotidyltransferase [Catellatospora sp. IY07-71]BCJ70708.1 hypothetical protein CS0771_02520 [Catellatospora sp. IY07-71]
MGMTATERRETLSRWIKPSSDHEQDQQERAERMVRQAIKASDAFASSNVLIYTKGSYPNNTNVRRDSDVDVVVELQDCIYFDYLQGQKPASESSSPYSGSWTPSTWRYAVRNALVGYFGSDGVDATGRIAINVKAVAGSRPSADVVPSFDYRRYDDPNRRTTHIGSCVFPSDGGDKIVNWPTQQLTNGRSLNTSTGGRYKYYVRALKNAENTLVSLGKIKDLPSYFMECLIYNVPKDYLTSGDLSRGFELTLSHLWSKLNDGSAQETMVEPNDLKWLFKGHQKWTVNDAKTLVLATFDHLGYGE